MCNKMQTDKLLKGELNAVDIMLAQLMGQGRRPTGRVRYRAWGIVPIDRKLWQTWLPAAA